MVIKGDAWTSCCACFGLAVCVDEFFFMSNAPTIIYVQKKYEPEKKHSYLKRSPKTSLIHTPPKSFVRKRELKTPPVPRMSKKAVFVLRFVSLSS